MKPILIVIRGNSGSGKTTVANMLQKHLGYRKCLLLHEDTLRRDILHENENAAAPIVNMIRLMIDFGMRNYQVTILEGILVNKKYGELLKELKIKLGENFRAYYLDVPFEQTILNNAQKKQPFSSQQLKKWWLDNDYLGNYECRLQNLDKIKVVQKISTDIAK